MDPKNDPSKNTPADPEPKNPEPTADPEPTDPEPATDPGQPSEPSEPLDKNGNPGINREKYQRDIEARDAKIADLQAKLDEAAKYVRRPLVRLHAPGLQEGHRSP